MSKTKVGLYIGTNSIGGVIVSDRTVISQARFDLTSLEEETRVESLSDEVKWEALINKTLREMGAESKDIYISLADRDFIYRFLEMPLMRKKEIESSLTYEIEKYIPFKLDELRWDYSYASFSKERKIDISFIGIKESIYHNVQGLFTRLDLVPVACEPASVSLARSLKSLKKFVSLRNFALLDFTLSEGYLTFFYHDLPVFNRYFIIPKRDDEVDLDEFVKPIRLSFQYFAREFRFYKLDKLIVIGNTPDEELLNMLQEDLQTEVEMCYPADFISEGGSVENLKALGVANMEKSAYKFRPNLRKTSDQLVRVKQELPLNKLLLTFLLGLGLLAYGAVWAFSAAKVAKARQELLAREAVVALPQAGPGVTWKTLEPAITDKFAKARALKGLNLDQKGLTPFLQRLIRSREDCLLPEGIWLENLSLQARENNYQGFLRGAAFLSDAYREREVIDEFAYDLNRTPLIKETFSGVHLGQSRREEAGDFELTSFSLDLR